MIEYLKQIALQRQISQERWPLESLWELRKQLESEKRLPIPANFRQVAALNGIQSVLLNGAFWARPQWQSEELPLLSSFLSTKKNENIVLRHGFLSTEGDLLENFALGFDGLLLHAEDKDPTELQYLIEICRDLKQHLVLVCASHKCLDLVLESDATNIGIWCDPNVVVMPDVAKMLSKIPKSCIKCAILPSPKDASPSTWLTIGFDVVI